MYICIGSLTIQEEEFSRKRPQQTETDSCQLTHFLLAYTNVGSWRENMTETAIYKEAFTGRFVH